MDPMICLAYWDCFSLSRWLTLSQLYKWIYY